ncbi:glutaminase A [Orrella daihaiensis]|uniref:Glutaminase n=1 Tax=Orrella daihaiensis TaxID=2782176 RepID=A0ABY4ALR5_9BURK|nr:glutaminase A [Orrella daihaiensis]UOD50017.1 glutaminase A [Orrella daihaiensis]
MRFDPVKLQSLVKDVHSRYKEVSGGNNASYIPYLADVSSTLSALTVVLSDGTVCAAGDCQYPFAIESISKVATLALALEDVGPEEVQQKIGADPTGLAFNSVMALELHGGKPQSPLVNAGAMATVSLVDAKDVEHRWQRILRMQCDLTGGDIKLSDEVNQSEQTTNFHNRAIAWLMYADGTMSADPMQVCDVYTRQCSTLITTVELAIMAATLAARGRNPKTGMQVLKGHHVPRILAEMTMEGLYDSSGDWAYTVGLPAKSGVGGGIMAVAPGKLGIAAFSPPLDGFGNSVRAQKMIADVAAELRLNLYDPA